MTKHRTDFNDTTERRNYYDNNYGQVSGDSPFLFLCHLSCKCRISDGKYFFRTSGKLQIETNICRNISANTIEDHRPTAGNLSTNDFGIRVVLLIITSIINY